MSVKIITVANQKGGCSKTTTVNNLGAALAFMGKKVLLIDVDPQANLSLGFGLELGPDELCSYHFIMGKCELDQVKRGTVIDNLYIIPSAIELAGAEIELTQAIAGEKKLYNVLRRSSVNDFDYILVDTPPFFCNLLTNGLSASEAVIIPVELRRYGIAGLRQLLDHVEAVRINVNDDLNRWFILPAMVDLRQKEDKEVLDLLLGKYKDNMLNTYVKRNIKVAEAVKMHVPVLLYDKTCPGSQSYIQLAIEIEEAFNNGAGFKFR